jgi:hypothetical protein
MRAAKHSIFWLFPLVFAPLCAEAEWPLGRDMPAAPKASESTPSIMSSGRYQVFVSPNIKGHTFMLDTDTGRVWIMRRDDTSGEFSLKRVPVEQVDQGQTAKGGSGKSKTEDKQPTQDK